MRKKRKLRVSYTVEFESSSDQAAIAACGVPDSRCCSVLVSKHHRTWVPGAIPPQRKVSDTANGMDA